MKVRMFLSGIAIAVALTGCSVQVTTSGEKPSSAISPVKQNSNTVKQYPPLATPTTREQNGTGTATPNQQEEKKVTMEPITLYELSPDDFDKKTSEIPSYDNGEISYWMDAEIKSFNEGHCFTWGDPLVRTLTQISNLIPYDYLQDRTIEEQLDKLEGVEYLNKTITVTTSNDIVFTKQPYDKETGVTVVEVQVPAWGTYLITWRNGQDSDIQIIHKITFQAESHLQSKKSIIILNLNESWFNRNASMIPAYSKGHFNYFEQDVVNSHNQGHNVPWSDPLVQGMLGIANLIPYDYLQDESITQQLTIRKETITSSDGIVFTPKYKSFQDRPALVEVKVPNLGNYTVTLNSGTDSDIAIIQKIVFEAD